MRFKSSRPIKLPKCDFAASMAAAMTIFNRNHRKNAREDARRLKEEQEKKNQMTAPIEIQEGNICFTLKTEAGILTYSQNDSSTYTDFVRASIDLLLAFNGSDIDPTFKNVIKHALEAYTNGEVDFLDLDSDDDSDNDYIERALKAQKEQEAEAKKYIASLPQSEVLILRILSCDIDDNRIENQFVKHTDFPPNVIHEIVHNHSKFELPFEKATRLYVDLRMLEVILSCNPAQSVNSKINIVKKTASRQMNKKAELTGKEKLKKEDGIIE